MKAFVITEPGAQPMLVEIDPPDPLPGEARIRVIAASVNGFDLAAGAGYFTDYFEYRYPVVLGREFMGVVDALGDGVEGVAVGDRVLGVVSKPYLAEGAFAEYTTADVASGVVHAPEAMSDAEAASLAHTGSTALACLSAMGDANGLTVLIVGATGGVGTLLVQLAAAAGATVIATGRTDEGRALMRELGAAHAVDYADLEGEVRKIAPDGVDAAVHLIGDPAPVSALVREGGIMISPVLPAPQMFPEQDRVMNVPIAGYPSGEGLRTLADLVDAGKLSVIVDRQHPFENVGQAFGEYGGEHKIGNIVVQIGE